MTNNVKPTLQLFCGKIAVRKSTLSWQLAAAPETVLISEDGWTSALYPGEISALEDYVCCSARLRRVMGHMWQRCSECRCPACLIFRQTTETNAPGGAAFSSTPAFRFACIISTCPTTCANSGCVRASKAAPQFPNQRCGVRPHHEPFCAPPTREEEFEVAVYSDASSGNAVR
jgi:hypothetical protein